MPRSLPHWAWLFGPVHTLLEPCCQGPWNSLAWKLNWCLGSGNLDLVHFFMGFLTCIPVLWTLEFTTMHNHCCECMWTLDFLFPCFLYLNCLPPYFMGPGPSLIPVLSIPFLWTLKLPIFLHVLQYLEVCSSIQKIIEGQNILRAPSQRLFTIYLFLDVSTVCHDPKRESKRKFRLPFVK